MPLDFEHQIPHGLIWKPVMGHEPTNDLWLYGIDESTAQLMNKLTYPFEGNYTGIIFEDHPAMVTVRQLRNFGIKHLPAFGAMAFYTLQHIPHSFILSPIHRRERRGTVPQVTYSVSGNIITFTISPNEDIYECYRIELQQSYFIQEKIVYGIDGVAVVDIPTSFSGVIIALVTGYSEEISIASETWQALITIGPSPSPGKYLAMDAISGELLVDNETGELLLWKEDADE